MTIERWIILVLVLVLFVLITMHLAVEKMLTAEEKNNRQISRKNYELAAAVSNYKNYNAALTSELKRQRVVITRMRKRLARKSGYTI